MIKYASLICTQFNNEVYKGLISIYKGTEDIDLEFTCSLDDCCVEYIQKTDKLTPDELNFINKIIIDRCNYIEYKHSIEDDYEIENEEEYEDD